MQRPITQKISLVEQRKPNPMPMHFTQRDSRILEAVHSFDGILSTYQIRRMFFTGERQCRGRLSLLFQHGYLARPNRRKRASLSCMVYWLDKAGAAHVAGLSGLPVREFRYRKAPRWSQLTHDLAVNDFRLDVVEAAQQYTGFELEQWIPEGEFWSHPDRVVFAKNGKKMSRLVRPDSFFVVKQGAYHSRLLLEIDMATEDNPRFGREKVLPGLAYLRSDAYKKRFGYKSGRWLVVTTSERRMHNMKRQAERALGTDASVFNFTTFDLVNAETVLTMPIWYRGGEDFSRPLFEA